MCYEIYHTCKYCDIHYHCELTNKLCPTVNFDADMNMCDKCGDELEENLKKMENEQNDFN